MTRTDLLVKLESEQAAGWSNITPLPGTPGGKLIVRCVTRRSRIDYREADYNHARNQQRRAITEERGDLRTREFMSPNYTPESRRRSHWGKQ